MSQQTVCDGCGVTLHAREPRVGIGPAPNEQAASGEHRGEHFDWCSLCTMTAFSAVKAAARARRGHIQGDPSRGM